MVAVGLLAAMVMVAPAVDRRRPAPALAPQGAGRAAAAANPVGPTVVTAPRYYLVSTQAHASALAPMLAVAHSTVGPRPPVEEEDQTLVFEPGMDGDAALFRINARNRIRMANGRPPITVVDLRVPTVQW
jgi:hypothetical protein